MELDFAFPHKVALFVRGQGLQSKSLTYNTISTDDAKHESQRTALTELIKSCIDKVSQANPNNTTQSVTTNPAVDLEESNRSKSIILMPSESSISKPAAGEIEDIIKIIQAEKKKEEKQEPPKKPEAVVAPIKKEEVVVKKVEEKEEEIEEDYAGDDFDDEFDK